MPPRLNKRQQRELEELQALGGGGDQALEEDNSADEDMSVRPSASAGGFSAFLALGKGDQDSEEEDDVPAKSSGKSKKSKKKKRSGVGAAVTSSGTGPGVVPSPRSETPSPPIPTSTSDKKLEGSGQPKANVKGVSQTPQPRNEKKALKKAKAKERKAGKDEIEQALAELSIKYPELQNAAASKEGASSSSKVQTNQTFYALLSVSLQHLDGDAELRRFFGAKVVQASKSSSASSSNAQSRRKDALARSNLTRPKPTWWPTKLREGLSIQQLTVEDIVNKGDNYGWNSREDGEKWWTVEYSKKYKATTKHFLSIVLSGDPDGFWALLSRMPYHADTLLQVGEVYRQREEYSQAVDLIDRALFAYERAFIGSFTFTSGNNRLDFDYVENRPFFLAVHRQVPDLQRRGCVRTAFEFARLLYSLDPWNDPHGSVFHLDFLALKAPGMREWLLKVYDFFEARRTEQFPAEASATVDAKLNPAVLPGWMYARALALWMEEDANKDSHHEKSTQALLDAVRSFPCVVPLLADKIEATLPTAIQTHSDFKIEGSASLLSREEAILHVLSHLYAQRSFPLWKEPQALSWFTQTVTSFASSLPPSLPHTAQLNAFLKLYSSTSLRESIYRHVVVLEASHRSLLGFLPQEITSARSLQCDPVPPGLRHSTYDSAYFSNVGEEDLFLGELGRTGQRRRLEQFIPDAAWRQQLQTLYDAAPALQQRFPGGVLQLAQALAQMPPDMVDDVLAELMAHQGQGQGGMEMPGHLDDDDQLDEVGPGNHEGTRVRDAAQGGEQSDGAAERDDDEDEDDEEELATVPRLMRNIFGRFFGRNVLAEPESSEDSEDEQARE